MTTKTEVKQTQRGFTIQDFLFWAEKGLEMYGLKGWNVVTGKNTWIKEPASGKDGGRLQLSSSQLRSSDRIALNHLGYQVSLAVVVMTNTGSPVVHLLSDHSTPKLLRISVRPWKC
jgi:hypothetical protein